jgi:trigger factor
MQITVKDESPIKKTLHIEIPAETVKKELDGAYQELKKTANIKGFRPGKAPLTVLKRIYKDKVHADVALQLIQNSLSDAVMEHKLTVVGEPVINSSELKEEEPFSYDATVEIKPELPDIDYKGLNLKKTIYRYSDEEVNNQMTMLRRSMATQEDIGVSRPAAQNDVALISFSGSHEGAPFSSFPKREEYRLKIGSAAISKAFDDQIVGMTQGDVKEFDIPFPEDFPDTQVAGKTIHFTVTLTSVKEEILPALDDAFAKMAGPYESLDQLTEAIRANLQSGYEKRSQQELNERVFEALLLKCDFIVPESMIKYELDGIIEEIERTYMAYNMSLENTGQTRESLAEKYRDTAEKQAKRHILLNKIIEQDNLDIAGEELEKGFTEISGSVRQPVDMVKQFYEKNPQQLNALKYSLLEQKAMKIIVESSHIEEIPAEKSGDDKSGE